MQELVDYIARYRPDYPATVEGASAEEIAALESAADQRLPASYRDFLATLGRSPGVPRPFAENFDIAIDDVLRFYRESEWTPPPPFLFIGKDRSGSELDLCLEPAGEAEPRVVRLGRGWEPGTKPFLAILYESLARMLFSESFANVRLPLLPLRATFVNGGQSTWDDAHDGTRVDAIAAIAQELDLPLVPHTGGWSPCYDAGEIALGAHQPPRAGMFLQAGAVDSARLAVLERILVRRLQLVRSA